jgi:hypothetical protein
LFSWDLSDILWKELAVSALRAVPAMKKSF